MLVCVGSALTMLVSAYGFSDALGSKNVVLDPARVAAQVISGIGFIGAGTIILKPFETRVTGRYKSNRLKVVAQLISFRAMMQLFRRWHRSEPVLL